MSGKPTVQTSFELGIHALLDEDKEKSGRGIIGSTACMDCHGLYHLVGYATAHTHSGYSRLAGSLTPQHEKCKRTNSAAYAIGNAHFDEEIKTLVKKAVPESTSKLTRFGRKVFYGKSTVSAFTVKGNI